ncbi:transcription elongation factor [Neurospora hispaniola]|uniref:Transcription elongation factor n=1 Tax=Neurospora hispaniola TaxID=588809 RepID=A0AAJ0MP46_9PEZI|nr:transcription elongation factor [Neurospora hispaniola]
MDDRELAARIKALSKAVTSDPPATVIKLLEELKRDAKPTEEQLRSTKAGVTVGKLRANPNKDIARIASEIVNKWRKLVEAAKEAKKKSQAAAASGASSPAPIASPAPASSVYNKPYTGDVEKRHFKTDKVDINRTSSQTRNNTIGVLYNGLAYRRTESIEEVVKRAVEVENALFKACKGENQEYRSKGRTLFTSLKRKDNAALGRRVMSGELPVERLVVLSDKELASEEQRARDEELEKENMKKAQVPMAEKSISDALKCGKCGQRKVSYSQAQTRSADEPMTTFCECTVCGNRWKFS